MCGVVGKEGECLCWILAGEKDAIYKYLFEAGNIRIVRPYILPRLHPPPGSKPVLKDRCCDGMINKRAPLPWFEAQNQPRRGAGENENIAHGAVLSYKILQKKPDTTTTATRNHAVICPHPGKKRDTLNTKFHTKNTTTNTASDKNHQSEVTT